MSGRYWKLGKSVRVKRALLALAVVVAAFAGLSWYGRAGADAPEAAGPPIGYDHLANQKTDPFLFSGKLMDESHPRWRQYRHAIQKFSDARDCLIGTEKNKPEPNLLLIDWKETGLGRGAEVCIFLIARSLGTIERHRQWLEFNGFQKLRYSHFVSDGFSPAYETQPTAYLSGIWTLQQYRRRKPSWFVRLTGLELITGYGVSIRYSEQQLVVGATASSRSK